MTKPKSRPFTEEELYVVPNAKAKVVPLFRAQAGALLTGAISMPVVSELSKPTLVSFIREHRKLLFTAGVVLICISFYMYHQQSKKKENARE